MARRRFPRRRARFKVGKAAQEAHEAIRPTLLSSSRPTECKAFLGRDEFRLYQLIWNRFVASQMETALFDTTRADIEAGAYTFQATGSVLKFPGWLAVYHEGKDEDAPADDARAADADAGRRRRPPAAAAEGRPDARSQVARSRGSTSPSRRRVFRSDARQGARRQRHRQTFDLRGHHRDDHGPQLRREGQGPVPPDRARTSSSTILIVASFGDIVDVGYTARMEEELDEIEEGRLNWVDALREFQTKFEADLARAKTEMRDVKREAIPTDQVCDKCGKPMVLKWGRLRPVPRLLRLPRVQDHARDRERLDGRRVAGDDRAMPAAAKTAKVRTAAPIRSRRRPSRARSAAVRWF